MGAKLLQPTLTAGEVAPSLYGRVDINRYAAGLRKCRNFIVRPYGGVENRPGLRFIARTNDVVRHRLIPFVFSDGVSYVLQLGDGYLRVLSYGAEVPAVNAAYAGGTTYAKDAYVTSAGVTYRSRQAGNVGHTPASSPTWWAVDAGLQITTPWAGADLPTVRYTQSADVMYLVHLDYPPKELKRTAANVFVLGDYTPIDGPFRDLNNDESVVVAANAVMGTVTLEANGPIFTANAVGSLFYLEAKNLGAIKPWVVGDRQVGIGTLRRSEGKTYKAVTVPSGGSWTETGNVQPVHESGRAWDGPGTSKTNGADTWYVGVEWEYVDAGYGVVKITGVTDSMHATGEVTRRLSSLVVGGVGTPSNSWTLSGDGTTTVFSITGAGYGIYSVTIGGVPVQSDPNYTPPPPSGGGGIHNPRNDGGPATNLP